MKPRNALARTFLIGLCLSGTGGVAAGQSTSPQESFRTVLLVRHGAYVAAPEAGELGSPLNSLGIAQARIVAARLAGLAGPTDALISSPMTRAHETARIVSTALPGADLELDPAIAECTPRSAITASSTAEAEAQAACTARLDSVFDALFAPSAERGRTVVVAHGNVIRYLVTRALGVDRNAWRAMSIGHTSITRVVVQADGGLQVISVGDIGHLPPNLQSGAAGLSAEPLAPA